VKLNSFQIFLVPIKDFKGTNCENKFGHIFIYKILCKILKEEKRTKKKEEKKNFVDIIIIVFIFRLYSRILFLLDSIFLLNIIFERLKIIKKQEKVRKILFWKIGKSE
jgi:hypothetical protein